MRTSLLIFVVLLAAIGCNDPRGTEELAKKNDELTQQLASRDRFIEEVTASIHEIHENIEASWAKEKNVLRQTTKSEEARPSPTPAVLKQRILDRIADMHATIMSSRKKMASLQQKLDESGKQYAGLQTMVDDLKRMLEEREQSILQLKARVGVLETEVSQQSSVIAAHRSTIDRQTQQLNTVYYLVGTRDELRHKGIITREGGVLWGLLGSTTVLASNFAESAFQTLEKTKEQTIRLHGTVDEIVPRRDTSIYTVVPADGGQTVLKISDPASFWRERHLVIVTE